MRTFWTGVFVVALVLGLANTIAAGRQRSISVNALNASRSVERNRLSDRVGC